MARQLNSGQLGPCRKPRLRKPDGSKLSGRHRFQGPVYRHRPVLRRWCVLALDTLSGPSPPTISTIPSDLEVERLRHELAVVGRVAERYLRRLGPLEVQVHVVLPREADASVHLDPV